jgi:hypothetical protein
MPERTAPLSSGRFLVEEKRENKIESEDTSGSE